MLWLTIGLSKKLNFNSARIINICKNKKQNKMSVLEYVHEDGVAIITLNNPPENRIGNEVSQKLGTAVMDIIQRNDTRAVLLKAKGEDFSFGGDITPWNSITGEEFTETLKQGIPLANMFENLPVPVIVAIQGNCLGGGFELALRGDILIAATNAKFNHPEATIGVFTFLGGIQRVAERIGKTRAIEWAMTSEVIDAQRAFDAGLINQVVPLEELDDTAFKWAQRLAEGPTLAHAAHKKLLRAWANGGVQAADDLMPEMAGEILKTEDAQNSIKLAIQASKEGKPRPKYSFKGI